MTAYDDLATPAQMAADCAAVGRNLGLPTDQQRREARLARAARAATRPAPGITYEAFPREVAKRDIAVSDAAKRLADALHLHLD